MELNFLYAPAVRMRLLKWRLPLLRQGAGLFFLLALTGPASAQYIEDFSPRSLLLAHLGEAAMLGMQLSVLRAERRADVPPTVMTCVKALDKSSFDAVLNPFLLENLTAYDLSVAEDFFASEVGRKYARHGLLQIYVNAGLELPEPFPEFSDAEFETLNNFSRTEAGEKLLQKKVMGRAPIRKAIEARTRELLATCHVRRSEEETPPSVPQPAQD